MFVQSSHKQAPSYLLTHTQLVIKWHMKNEGMMTRGHEADEDTRRGGEHKEQHKDERKSAPRTRAMWVTRTRMRGSMCLGACAWKHVLGSMWLEAHGWKHVVGSRWLEASASGKHVRPTTRTRSMCACVQQGGRGGGCVCVRRGAWSVEGLAVSASTQACSAVSTQCQECGRRIAGSRRRGEDARRRRGELARRY